MKRRITLISSLVIVALSMLFLLYGSIKLARAEKAPQFENEIPGAKVEQPAVFVSQKNAQSIIGVSLVTLGLGGVGVMLSSRKELT